MTKEDMRNILDELDDLTLGLNTAADMLLGVPFNIASYALLLSIVAQVTDKQPGG